MNCKVKADEFSSDVRVIIFCNFNIPTNKIIEKFNKNITKYRAEHTGFNNNVCISFERKAHESIKDVINKGYIIAELFNEYVELERSIYPKINYEFNI